MSSIPTNVPKLAIATSFAIGAYLGYTMGSPILATALAVTALVVVKGIFEHYAAAAKVSIKDENLKGIVTSIAVGFPLVYAQHALGVLTRYGLTVQLGVTLGLPVYFTACYLLNKLKSLM